MADAYGDFADLVPKNNNQQTDFKGNVVQNASGAPAPTAAPNYGDFGDLVPQKEQQSTFMDMVDGFNRAFGRTAEAVMQPVVNTTDYLGITNNAANKLDAYKAQQDAQFAQAQQNSPYAANIGYGAGTIGATVATAPMIPGGSSAITGAAPSAMGRIAEMGSLGAAQGYLGTYGSNEDRLRQSLAQGGLSALGQGVGEGVSGLASYGANKLFTGNTPQEAANMINQGGALTAGSATGNKGLQALESTMTNVPLVGTKGGMEKTVTQNQDMAKGIVQDLASYLRGGKTAGDKINAALLDDIIPKSMDKTGNIDLNNLRGSLDEIINNSKIGGLSKESFPPELQNRLTGLNRLIYNSQHILENTGSDGDIKSVLKAGGALGGIAWLGKDIMKVLGGDYTAAGKDLLYLGGGKALSSLLTNPNSVKNLIKLGGGELSDEATQELTGGFLSSLIKNALKPAAAKMGADAINKKEKY